MGQSVTVVAKPSSNPGVLRFEINRSLTGMGHERYRSLADVVDDRAVDVLARRLLEHGGVDGVHVNSSVITIDLAGGSTGEGLEDIIRNMFRFYGDEAPEAPAGIEPPEPEEPAAEAESTEAAETSEGTVTEPDAAEAPESAADHAVAAEGTPAEASDAPGDAPEPRPGDREPGQATAAAEEAAEDAAAAADAAASDEGDTTSA